MLLAFADRLRDLRRARGESLQQTAEAVGASKAHISDLERGAARNPGLELVRALAAHFDVTVSDILDEAPATRVVPAADSSQVTAWIRMIRKEQAAGHDLETAAAEARATFENMLGSTLDAQQEANWAAARQQIMEALARPVEFLGNLSLRKPRRPQWYSGGASGALHWPALEAYLLTRKNWKAEAVASIDSSSTEVVSLLENPAQSGFRGRGLVVGYVQSGKTANMTAVIAKAVDAGYRFIIVLAGLTNALRRQTQRRLEDDLLQRHRHSWLLHTTEENSGDFRTPANRWFVVTEQAQVAVVKKNVTPLRQLIRTIEKTIPAHRERLPVLIIDDECDQASVNAGGQYSITQINQLIRTLLALLPRAQYVGYTATPFANVLINPEKPAGGLDDLYPEDFITALPLPDDYFGPESLFGRDPVDADHEQPDERGLDMIRTVRSREVAFLRPASARGRHAFEPEMTPSLRRALRYFVLSTACRYLRGQRGQHCSMLVHTTVYTTTHQRLAEVIRTWIGGFKAAIASPEIHDRLERLWLAETARVDPAQFGRVTPSYAEIRPLLDDVLADLEVVVENSASETRLDFTSGPRKYIVVGGSVLARGLTIEGLTVSLFVRSSSQYDTLLQMGRWFGFRPGYEDLPRIWMTPDLEEAFRDLATVEAEIRADMAVYREQDLTPADFAVRIRQIPGMTVTSAAKMISAEACDISFSGEHLQTIRFQHRNAAQLRSNWAAGARLIDRGLGVGPPETVTGGRLVRGVPLEVVLEFLRTYQASPKDSFGPALLTYIESEAARADAPFQTWNVGVIEPGNALPSGQPLGGLGPVSLVRRARLNIERADGAADIKALMSRRDVRLDGTTATAATDWNSVKRARQREIGDRTPLLLLYAIDRLSEPARDTSYRTALDAVADVLGIGLVLPERGQRRSYVRVRLPQEDADETEDVAADMPEAEGEG
jgi:transcriptional regulator with XRE-family HTH domain